MEKEKKRYLLDKVYMAKRKCLDMCVHAGEGHLTSAFSCAEIVTVLYYDLMCQDREFPQQDQDHFFMSKNHGSVIAYPILADLGFIEEKDLMTFLQDGSVLGAHSKLCISGVEFAGGSLGIGLGVAAGFAYGQRMKGGKGKTFVLVGDGECYEGSVWESVMFAGHQKLDNLVAIVDMNGLAMTDFTQHMLNQEPMTNKWSAFQWEVLEVNGHDVEEISEALRNAVIYKGKPICIIANTEKGHGVPFMCNNPFVHGVAPKGKEIPMAYAALDKEHEELLRREDL